MRDTGSSNRLFPPAAQFRAQGARVLDGGKEPRVTLDAAACRDRKSEHPSMKLAPGVDGIIEIEQRHRPVRPDFLEPVGANTEVERGDAASTVLGEHVGDQAFAG